METALARTALRLAILSSPFGLVLWVRAKEVRNAVRRVAASIVAVQAWLLALASGQCAYARARSREINHSSSDDFSNELPGAAQYRTYIRCNFQYTTEMAFWPG